MPTIENILATMRHKPVGYDADVATAFAQIPPGLCCEFGVLEGRTLRPFAEALAPRTLYGFDWFKGLPETWAPTMAPKGSMACAVPQNLPPNAELVIGLFQNTLRPFLGLHREPVAFCHFDADLYTSTKYVLDVLRNHLADGAIFIFDEIINSSYNHEHEARAFAEWLTETGFGFECIGMRHRNAGIFRIDPPRASQGMHP